MRLGPCASRATCTGRAIPPPVVGAVAEELETAPALGADVTDTEGGRRKLRTAVPESEVEPALGAGQSHADGIARTGKGVGDQLRDDELDVVEGAYAVAGEHGAHVGPDGAEPRGV